MSDEVFRADLAAHGRDSWRFRYRLTNPEINFQRTLRNAERYERPSLWRIPNRIYWRIRLHRLSLQTGISIPPGVFGPGLAIAHYGSIVVNSDCRVGANCRIHSGTNIGSTADGVPEIGDDVYIGPGAVIFGPVKVGNRSVIGANAVVNRDVPPSVTVAGAPARIVANRGSDSIHPNVPRRAVIKK